MFVQKWLASWPRGFLGKTWSLLQFVAVAVLFATPFWFQNHSSGSMNRTESLVKASMSGVPEPSDLSLRSAARSGSASVASRVLRLPVPHPSLAATTMSYRVPTRQLRLERVLELSDSKISEGNRKPAALSDWRLVEIKKKTKEGWLPLPLIKNDDSENLGTQFVELDRGLNEFEVSFVGDAKGKKRSTSFAYKLRVEHY